MDISENLHVTSSSQCGKPANFSDLPKGVLKQVLKHILCVREVGVLDDSTLKAAKQAHDFCTLNSKMYAYFRSCFHTLYLSGVVPVDLYALGRLFGSSLQHISINMDPGGTVRVYETECDPDKELSDAEISVRDTFREYYRLRAPKHDYTLFLNGLAECNLRKLESLSVEILRSRKQFCSQSLTKVIISAKNSLRALRLSLPNFDYSLFADNVALHLGNLRALCIEPSRTLREEDLLKLLQSAAGSLRHLVLNALSHESFTGCTPRKISETCALLSHVEIRGMSHSFTYNIHDIPSILGERLVHFDVRTTSEEASLPSEYLHVLAGSCPNLSHFCIPHVQLHHVDQCSAAVTRVAENLISVRIMTLLGTWGQRLSSMANVFSQLSRLYLHFTEEDCDVLIETILYHVGPQLSLLDIENQNLTPCDRLVRAITVCSRLTNFRICIKPDHKRQFAPNVLLSRAGIMDMLSGIGKYLEDLTWDVHVHPNKKLLPAEEKLDSVGFMDCVLTCCQRLKVVSLDGLLSWSPEDWNLRADMAERKPYLMFYLRKPRPFWFSVDSSPWERIIPAERPYISFF